MCMCIPAHMHIPAHMNVHDITEFCWSISLLALEKVRSYLEEKRHTTPQAILFFSLVNENAVAV